MSSAFQDLLALAREQKLPPVHLWQPTQQGKIDIVIRQDGTWFHEGREIHRHGIAKVFSSILRREGDEYFLVTPAEKLEIEVEESPFVITDFEACGSGSQQHIVFKTNLDDVVSLDKSHCLTVLESDSGPRPYVHIRNGLTARVLPAVFYRLADFVEDPEADPLAIWSCGSLFRV